MWWVILFVFKGYGLVGIFDEVLGWIGFLIVFGGNEVWVGVYCGMVWLVVLFVL